MINFLLRTGILLMAVAATIIATAFFMFTLFAFALMLPGLLVYNIGLKMGLKNIYYDVKRDEEIYDGEGMRTINGSTLKQNEFVGKAKTGAKTIVKKVRNFLNRYAD